VARPLRIAVDARGAAEVPAGRGRYVRELLRALARLDAPHRYDLICRRPWDGGLDERFRWIGVAAGDPRWLLGAARAARRADVVFATSSYALCALVDRPSAAFVHDLLAFDPAMRTPGGALAERATLPLAARRARALLCNSEATRRELIARFPRAADRAEVTPLAADPAFGRAEPGDADAPLRHGIARPYVLSTATVEPRKNLPRLIEAFAALPVGVRDGHELVLVGARGWEEEETLAAVRRHAGLVRTLGYVEDGDLRALYRRATVFAYPSLGEGFGLPVLEAMTAGVPVLTSDRSSLPEVAGGAARLVDPEDTGTIRDGLAALLGDPAERDRRAVAGRERARAFSWDATARATLAALERIA
jgi:glycosyltransferase involved in cell wall biosynthesis